MDTQYLELKSISKDFGGLRAINHLSLNVGKGEVVCIIGPNGAGKTTLLNLITGVLPITSGEIYFKGKRIDRLPSYRICKLGINRSFQDVQLFTHMSVVENVMVGCHNRMRSTFPEIMLSLKRVKKEHQEAFERAIEKLSLFDLDKRIYDMPANLALKDRKLLGIARALATEPELLLLDEPVGGLSVEEIKEISEKIIKMQEEGLTLLFIEHRMELVRSVSERVIVLDFGQKLAEGTFNEVHANKQVINAYLGKEEE